MGVSFPEGRIPGSFLETTPVLSRVPKELTPYIGGCLSPAEGEEDACQRSIEGSGRQHPWV